MRAFLVLNSLLNKSVISDVKAVRRRPSYAPSLLGPSAWLQHGFSIRINLWEGGELGPYCSVHV